MRHPLLSTLVFLSFAVSLLGEIFEVTPRTLEGWRVIGSVADGEADGTGLVLEPAAQVARRFATPNLHLSVSTYPLFSEIPEEWPVLEIGEAALVFVRHSGAGKLFLTVGTLAPVLLPFEFRLDEQGLSKEMLNFTFAQSVAGWQVTVGGQTAKAPVETRFGQSPEVVISAGANEPWFFAKITIETEAPSFTAPQSVAVANSLSPKPQSLASSTKAAPTGLDPGLMAVGARILGELPANGISGANHHESPGSLQVFTPPAVRHGRSDKVRQDVAASLNQK